MAKSPVKNPPIAQDESGEASVPSLHLENSSSSVSMNDSETKPTLDPPFTSSGDAEDSFGAGVWNNDKRINGLFSTNETRNAWISVVGVGWLKLANSIDSANESLNIVANAAKIKNSPINYLLENGQVTQIYVW
ncbi:hypothetical protein RCH18_000555 [Flavobacterium sp. PL11]|jgi:hypothetical protein|uniref:hypothetical protein n=1 Tax=Flavobacterium sp. PL11 TaxID=3071717 RepID=UPI002DFB8798|nr:hypothetical protein [Flavobacterium sp. PL11]